MRVKLNLSFENGLALLPKMIFSTAIFAYYLKMIICNYHWKWSLSLQGVLLLD